jgi:hypothetical protein
MTHHLTGRPVLGGSAGQTSAHESSSVNARMTMKKALVPVILAAFVLAGCAGMSYTE